jgi:hypothetical protein
LGKGEPGVDVGKCKRLRWGPRLKIETKVEARGQTYELDASFVERGCKSAGGGHMYW